MSSKTHQRKGWLREWFSKSASGERRDLDRRLRKLRCEVLERRELLSINFLGESFQYIPLQSTSGVVSGTSYTATANLTGKISYVDPTQGIFYGSLTGEAFNAGLYQVDQNGDNLSGYVDVWNSPHGSDRSVSLSEGSTIDTSQFTATNTHMYWTTPSGAYSAMVRYRLPDRY